jgi:citrate lyase subunit beta/citryl-CoA lyase
MPGSNARALEKARTLPADALILDLEDAVAPEAKDAARAQVREAVKQGFGRRMVAVRINALSTPWGEADLEAAAAAGPDAILVTKVETGDDILEVGRRLARLGAPRELQIWAMMETPLALLHAGEIAAAARDDAGLRLACLVMGTNDIAKETRARLVPGRGPMRAWLSTCVVAARAYGLSILDGVYNGLGDAQGLRQECEDGRDLGFDGKTLIHPNQIEAANDVFAPSDAEIEEAREIIAAFELPENRGKGAVSLQGRMVERLHADVARRTLALADAIRALEPPIEV